LSVTAEEKTRRTRPQSLASARKLRRNLTDAERKLWHYLRQRQLGGFHFRKQCPIGPFIADFACLKAKLIVEVDGGQHADSASDQARDAWFAAHGYWTLRFWNNDVLQNVEGVFLTITAGLGQLETTPHAQAH
jgi:very-short-patch-repair endonuclease